MVGCHEVDERLLRSLAPLVGPGEPAVQDVFSPDRSILDERYSFGIYLESYPLRFFCKSPAWFK